MRYRNLHIALLVPVALMACTSPAAPTHTGQSQREGSAQNEMSQNTIPVGHMNDNMTTTSSGSDNEQKTATISSALLGEVLGGVIGKSMNRADRTAYEKASQKALESGEQQAWANPENGHHGTIVPLKSYMKS